MSGNVPLSVAVITLNEEDNIERCLEGVQWADDIVVVDSGSEDRTCEQAESLGARVIHHDWEGHVKQKQFATDQARYDWVLSLDADEEVSPQMAGSVRELFHNGPPRANECFMVNRLAHYLGRWIYHGSWYPDWIVRLFNRTSTRWGGRDPHDRVRRTDRVRKLEGPLYHFPYRNLSDHLEYVNYYTTIMAREKDDERERGTLLRAMSHALFKFFRDYVLKRGCLDGRAGFVLAVIGSYYVFLKYAKLWERQNLDVSTVDRYPKDPSR